MIRSILLVPLLCFASSFAPLQEKLPESQPPPAASNASVRIHVVKMPNETTWFDDRWRHAVGGEVMVSVDGTLNTGVAITFASVDGRKTSGCSVTVKLAKGPDMTTVADIQGEWWFDFGKPPRRGELEDIEGDIYISQEFINPLDLVVKFSIRAKALRSDVALLGATKFVMPFK